MSEKTLNNRRARIYNLIEEAFSPAEIIIEDQSERHKHHREQIRGPQAKGETHFSLKVISPTFNNMRRVERSRKVHKILQREFDDGLHALSLKLLTPEESCG